MRITRYQTLPVQGALQLTAPGETNARYKPYIERLHLREKEDSHGSDHR